MLSSPGRAAFPYERFEAAAQAHPEEVAEAIRAYGAVEPDAPATARLALGNGDALTLVQEGGRWRLDPSSLTFYAQDTPERALRSFVRAVERSRWDVLVALAPQQVAAELTADGGTAGAEARLRSSWGGPDAGRVTALARRMRDAMDRGAALEVSGDRATMAFGRGGQSLVRLAREDGRWRVDVSDAD